MNKKYDDEEQDLEVDKSDQIFNETNPNFKSITRGEFTETDLLANSFLFFIAGYETTASVLSHLFYSLALNQKCQQKLYEEVKAFDGNYDYESISKMPYLEACVAETLRIYNPVPSMGRVASEQYTLGLF